MASDQTKKMPTPLPHELPRRRLARELQGDGIEFGPGCHPLPLTRLVTRIRYCDRFDKETFAQLFPELADHIDGFPSTIDFPLDFEREDFDQVIGPASVDFVIASHVIEHLVNPLLFLSRVHRLLRNGGQFYLAIPDKRAFFDRDRRRTPLRELIDRHEQGTFDLTDEMIVRFLNEAEQPETPITPTTPGYHERIADCRRRSIHTNVWLADDLIEILEYVARHLHAPFEILDGLATDIEFILILRQTSDVRAIDRYPTVLGRIWFDSYRHAQEQYSDSKFTKMEELIVGAHQQLMVLDERARETQGFVKRIKGALDRLPIAGSISRWVSNKKSNE